MRAQWGYITGEEGYTYYDEVKMIPIIWDIYSSWDLCLSPREGGRRWFWHTEALKDYSKHPSKGAHHVQTEMADREFISNRQLTWARSVDPKSDWLEIRSYVNSWRPSANVFYQEYEVNSVWKFHKKLWAFHCCGLTYEKTCRRTRALPTESVTAGCRPINNDKIYGNKS